MNILPAGATGWMCFVRSGEYTSPEQVGCSDLQGPCGASGWRDGEQRQQGAPGGACRQARRNGAESARHRTAIGLKAVAGEFVRALFTDALAGEAGTATTDGT